MSTEKSRNHAELSNGFHDMGGRNGGGCGCDGAVTAQSFLILFHSYYLFHTYLTECVDDKEN